MRFVIAVSIAAVLAGTTVADETTARVADSKAKVLTIRVGGKLLLHADQVARAFGWKAEVVQPGKLLTLCQTSQNGVCVPLQLDKIATHNTAAGLFVDARAVAQAIGLSIDDRKGTVTLRQATELADREDDLPAYNAAWGEGRGFQVGQTLPDIPLYDLDGKEVRFSRYLGTEYIIYCWASW